MMSWVKHLKDRHKCRYHMERYILSPHQHKDWGKRGLSGNPVYYPEVKLKLRRAAEVTCLSCCTCGACRLEVLQCSSLLKDRVDLIHKGGTEPTGNS